MPGKRSWVEGKKEGEQKDDRYHRYEPDTNADFGIVEKAVPTSAHDQ
jgi:hypothetical protein